MPNIKRLPIRSTLCECISALALVAIFSVGCGGERISVPDTVPVKGVVKFNGKPAPGVRVTFHNQDDFRTKGFVPTAETGPDGGFILSSGAPQNGAPTGTYLVTFERPLIDPTNAVETEIDGFCGKYSDPKQSQWTVTIAEGVNLLEPFELR